MKKLVVFIDNSLLILIVLSVIQIFIGDLAVINGWFSSKASHILFDKSMIIAGFTFDTIFSIEFTVRSIIALKHKNFVEYFFYRRGWIDFLASLPLLITNSFPQFYSLVVIGALSNGGRGMINTLKAVKAVRVTRILRLLRTLKIFGKIENVFSKMSQHHISTISSLVVTVSISVYMLFSMFGWIAFPSAIDEARVSFLFTTVLVVNVLFIAFFYARHFAQNISDPIYVIKRGLTETRYNFTVHIKKPYADEEIFELARAYNQIWLPMKVRVQKIRDKKAAEAAMPIINEDDSDLLG